jgi:group I intron endonuclease
MDCNNTYCVYIHINKINNKAYIGQTVYGNDINLRWKNNGKGYLKKDSKGNFTQPVFANAINKYGWDNFEHIIWANNLTAQEANHIEKVLIELFDTTNSKYGYNIRSGGENSTLSEETKRKISESRKGKYTGINNPWYGKHPSDETRQKMRENHADITGEKHPNYGKHLSDETRLKISEARKGKYVGKNNPNSKKVCQYDTNGELIKIWDSVIEASNELGINRCCIGDCARGGQKTAGGYVWKYIINN